MKNYLAIFFLIASTFIINAQKFHLRSGVGISSLNWYENQSTANFSFQLTYQKPNSSKLFFSEVKTFGNIANSKVDPAHYEFIPYQMQGQTQPMELDINKLSATYRGGSAEIGVLFNQTRGKSQPFLSPEVSFFSISLARKISTDLTHYVEEEKYALHGLSAGLNLILPGKAKWIFSSKAFLPILTNFTLYGRYIGVPYETSSQKNEVSWRNQVEVDIKKFNFGIDYDLYNLGGTENLKSKTILNSQNKMLSVYINYLF